MEPRKILVVDSSKTMHRVFELALRQHKLIYATDGREALALLRDHLDVDLVLTALNMLDMNGLELLAELRKLDSEAPPVVVVWTEGHEEEATTALRSGAADSIKKPFAPEELVALIARLPSQPDGE